MKQCSEYHDDCDVMCFFQLVSVKKKKSLLMLNIIPLCVHLVKAVLITNDFDLIKYCRAIKYQDIKCTLPIKIGMSFFKEVSYVHHGISMIRIQ